MDTIAAAADTRSTLKDANLSHATVHVRAALSKTPASEWTDADGRQVRSAFQIHLDPRDHAAFTIILASDATQKDLENARQSIQSIRAGAGRHPDKWRQLPDGKFDFLFTGHHIRVSAEESAAVIACCEPRCPETWHSASDRHIAESIYRELPLGAGGYTIELLRDVEDEEHRGWYVDVFTDEFYGTPGDVADFVNDLSWVQEECRRANAPALGVAS